MQDIFPMANPFFVLLSLNITHSNLIFSRQYFFLTQPNRGSAWLPAGAFFLFCSPCGLLFTSYETVGWMKTVSRIYRSYCVRYSYMSVVWGLSVVKYLSLFNLLSPVGVVHRYFVNELTYNSYFSVFSIIFCEISIKKLISTKNSSVGLNSRNQLNL